ncbi:MAG: hypothetical protein R3266_07635 [Gemmatimonadota bacterium]|nr:hypothetical protein [Gemmatimonadota bacterium]
MPADPPARRPEELTHRAILFFWAPLAATWLMMAAEGPFIAAVVARLPDPKIGLAAFGVSIAFAVLIESPVIMLLSAATALVEDALSYRRMRAFANGLNLFSTGLLLLTLVPPVHTAVFQGALGLPAEVADLTYGALWCFLPWPAAIGYRRFLQGVLIRSGETRLVAYGTVIRLAGMSASAIALAVFTGLPGASVGAAALSTGVVIEALAARWMAREAIARLLVPAAGPSPGEARHELGYREIFAFYYPLALTSLIGLAIQPMLTFFMGRAPAPVESLAVFPVVHALGFVFRSIGLSFQDAAIALLGRGGSGYASIRSFAVRLGIVTTAIMVAIAFTPLADVWFRIISGLTEELTAFAIPAARVLSPIPFLGIWLSLQRGVLMKGRRTRPITVATAAEVAVVAVAFAALGWGVGLVGVTAAFVALVVGRSAANLYLIGPVRRALARGDFGRRESAGG